MYCRSRLLILLLLMPNRFSYTYYDKTHGPIYKSIEALDRVGMDIIETGDANAFKQYLKDYGNTICGRHPISIFLHVLQPPYLLRQFFDLVYHSLTILFFYQMLKNCTAKIKIGFLQYEQSSQCKSTRDSSVSYASAAAKLDD